MCVAFFVFATRSMHRYESLHAYYFDLGIMYQVVANTAHGHFLEMTDPNYYFQGNRLGYHFDFILALFVPFYLLFNDARVLLIGQSLTIVLGALPLFLLAKGHLKNRIAALAIATLYLLYFPVHATIIADFHAVALSTSFILWMWYAIEKGRYKLAMLMIVLSWMTKENVPLVTGAIGFYFYFKGHKKFGGALFAASVAWFLAVYKIIMPHFRGGAHFAETYYTADFFTNLQRLFSADSFQYAYALLYPLLFLPLLAPQFLLLPAFEWLIILLSANTNLRELQYHYTALLTPFIFIALIYGFKKIKSQKILYSLLAILLFMQWSFLFKRSTLLHHYPPAPETEKVVAEWQHILSDPTIPVSTTGHLASHFSGRQYFYNFLYDYGFWNQGITEEQIRDLVSHYEKADYVLIKESEIDPTDERVMFYYFHLKNSKKFTKIFDKSGIEVYKKVYNDGI
jgi:uncharacterized membrane protein